MKATKRDLIGRKIVAVDFHRFRTATDPRGASRPQAWATQPVLTLDNGRRVWFSTEETEVGEYGTAICISEPPEKPR